jgi:hypothetical protein
MKITKSELKEMIRECLREELTLTESALTAEEKVDAWHAGTRRENYRAAGIPKLNTFLDIAKRKGYTEIVDIIERELASRTDAAAKMDWEDLIEEADALLEELCIESGNTDWDDGDGYWSGEVGHRWTMRKLFTSDVLVNVDKLEKLCYEYSKKLPNVEFYYYADDFLEEPISEIGYNATNPDYEEDF